VSDLLGVGDVIYVSPPDDVENYDSKAAKPQKGVAKPVVWRLEQIPRISGAAVLMDPHTGRVLALVGGFSFAESQFDRAVQARRQPGSSFKPIVYAAAIDNGYTPASIINDQVIAIEQGPGLPVWKPENDDKQIHGPSTLRTGLVHSRNLMTVRLSQDLGMPIISEYARRFGVYDDLPSLLSMALGAGETTLIRLTTAYCMFVNGGKKINYTFIDRIQDRYGHTVWRHDNRKCESCEAASWQGQDEPELSDDRKQVIDPMTAYQIVSMLQGVVEHGTGYLIGQGSNRPLAGKTGTTNDEKDAWFIGFSPDLALGVFIGYDNPTPLGHGETGGRVAAPVFRDFFKLALGSDPAVPFRTPPGIRQVRINKNTGQRTDPADPDAIVENFKPGTEPPDNYYEAGYQGASGPPSGAFPPRPPAGDWGAAAEPAPYPRPRYDGGPFGQRPSAGGLY
jgi:penicillin-binding protein 1A